MPKCKWDFDIECKDMLTWRRCTTEISRNLIYQDKDNKARCKEGGT